MIRMDVDEITRRSTLSFVLTGFFVCNSKAALDPVGTQDMGISILYRGRRGCITKMIGPFWAGCVLIDYFKRSII